MREPIHSGKVSEAALSKSIAVSVVGILLCMICLVGTTWAWYSLSIESGDNDMTGANFDFSVKIDDDMEPYSDGVYAFEGGTYTVTLTKVEGCTAEKGFCKVIATKSGEEDEPSVSCYIVNFTGADPISFTVTGSGTLMLIPMLGTPTEGYSPIPSEGIALLPDSEPENDEFVDVEEEDQIEGDPDDESNEQLGEGTGDSTDGKGTTEPDEDDEIVNENETPSNDTPTNSEPTNSEPAETEQTEIPTEQNQEPTTQE